MPIHSRGKRTLRQLEIKVTERQRSERQRYIESEMKIYMDRPIIYILCPCI